MKHRSLFIFIGLILFLIAAVSLSADKYKVKFIEPKGWGKPKYDFSKNPLTDAGFKLGRRLFFDPILSRDSSTSCVSCHLQFTAFTHVDHALSHGINGLVGNRNSPALQNLAWQQFFMWDGGVNNLEVQPISPITNPLEMGNTLQNVVDKLNRSAKYRNLYYEAFGDSVATGQHTLKALAQFLVCLESFNSKYDSVMRGEQKFSASEKNGFRIFKKNCATCHTGQLMTDGAFHNTGLPYDVELKDAGRMKITHDVADSMKFKTPSLRNIFSSYPYMHDGRFRNLEQVINFYTEDKSSNKLVDPVLKRKIILSAKEKSDLILFLKTVTDRVFLYDMRFRDWVY